MAAVARSDPRADPSVLEELRARVQLTVSPQERALPVREDLAPLFPLGGLPRGGVVGVDTPSVLFASLSAAMGQGTWAAICGAPSLGVAAAADYGVALERLAIVHVPEGVKSDVATVVAALIDAVDLVVIGPGLITRAADARRLLARARERGSVMFSLGGWPEAVDIRLHTSPSTYAGLGDGHGHLTAWSCEVRSDGRGGAARTRRITFQTGSPSGLRPGHPEQTSSLRSPSGLRPEYPEQTSSLRSHDSHDSHDSADTQHVDERAVG